MYSAEPLPHFVDEYLSYLYEAHPTNATFDGVHTYDDLLEEACRMAGAPIAEMEVRPVRRLLEEAELRSRGWTW